MGWRIYRNVEKSFANLSFVELITRDSDRSMSYVCYFALLSLFLTPQGLPLEGLSFPSPLSHSTFLPQVTLTREYQSKEHARVINTRQIQIFLVT